MRGGGSLGGAGQPDTMHQCVLYPHFQLHAADGVPERQGGKFCALLAPICPLRRSHGTTAFLVRFPQRETGL